MDKKKKIKVFHIITKLELGGAQKITLQTLEGLNKHKFSAGLITSAEGMMLKEAQEIKGITLYTLENLDRPVSPLRDAAAFFSIYKILRKEKPHIVQTHSSKAGIVGRWAAFFARVPIIIHSVHGFSFNDYLPFSKKWFFIILEKITSKITSYYFIDSKENILAGEKHKLFRKKNFIQIKPGIDLRQFIEAQIDKKKEKKRIGIPAEAAVVEMIACLKAQKAPLDFARVAALVQKEFPASYFILVGDGELRKEMDRLLAELKLGEHFKMLSWRRDIVQLIGLCDIMMLTSLWEGLPTVLPMARAMKKPIVATRIDGNKEVVADAEHGYLVEPHDIKAMADRIIYLLKNPEIMKNMGRQGAIGVEIYDVERMIQGQEQFYIKAVKNKGEINT
jgi:glycosyltransferase involved in cell wall biosynthesis